MMKIKILTNMSSIGNGTLGYHEILLRRGCTYSFVITRMTMQIIEIRNAVNSNLLIFKIRSL